MRLFVQPTVIWRTICWGGLAQLRRRLFIGPSVRNLFSFGSLMPFRFPLCGSFAGRIKYPFDVAITQLRGTDIKQRGSF